MRMSNSVAQPRSINEDLGTKVRKLIAEYLCVDPVHLSDKAHFISDLDADWLDRLELIMVVEDHFGVEIADDVFDRMEAVGDVIRFIESQPRH